MVLKTRAEYQVANWHLAHLLGWREIQPYRGALVGRPPWRKDAGTTTIPDWCGSWHECMQLAVAHRIDVTHGNAWTIASHGHSRVLENYANHNSHCPATRYAVVLAVIWKLEKAPA